MPTYTAASTLPLTLLLLKAHRLAASALQLTFSLFHAHYSLPGHLLRSFLRPAVLTLRPPQPALSSAHHALHIYTRTPCTLISTMLTYSCLRTPLHSASACRAHTASTLQTPQASTHCAHIHACSALCIQSSCLLVSAASTLLCTYFSASTVLTYTAALHPYSSASHAQYTFSNKLGFSLLLTIHIPLSPSI
jgi:hypothetical protein